VIAYKWMKVTEEGLVSTFAEEPLRLKYTPGAVTTPEVGMCLVFKDLATAIVAPVGYGTELWKCEVPDLYCPTQILSAYDIGSPGHIGDVMEQVRNFWKDGWWKAQSSYREGKLFGTEGPMVGTWVTTSVKLTGYIASRVRPLEGHGLLP